MICTFFGHRDTPKEIEPILRSTLVDLIENKGVDRFYVGNNGSFDFMVRKTLINLKQEYEHIDYAVVLPYMPSERKKDEHENYGDTLFPAELANVPPRFAISCRNDWMLGRAELVVAYVRYGTGGAAKFKQLAEKRGTPVINLADMRGL